jgi:hypothetical protein
MSTANGTATAMSAQAARALSAATLSIAPTMPAVHYMTSM